jgi:hypothetical protein
MGANSIATPPSTGTTAPAKNIKVEASAARTSPNASLAVTPTFYNPKVENGSNAITRARFIATASWR